MARRRTPGQHDAPSPTSTTTSSNNHDTQPAPTAAFSPSASLRLVVDLLALRAVHRQACELLRLVVAEEATAGGGGGDKRRKRKGE